MLDLNPFLHYLSFMIQVEAVVDHRVRGRFTEYKVRWKGYGPMDDSWVPEAELCCDNLLNKYFKNANKEATEEEAYEVSIPFISLVFHRDRFPRVLVSARIF